MGKQFAKTNCKNMISKLNCDMNGCKQKKIVLLFLIYLLIRFFGNSFPKFWAALQQELDANEEDLMQIKSIFTALDYMTLPSIATIKNVKNLKSLESEYIGMRTNPNIFDEKCNKFPALKGIHSFSSGMIATMMNVVMHLNPKKQAIIVDEVTQEKMLATSKETVMVLAKNVRVLELI